MTKSPYFAVLLTVVTLAACQNASTPVARGEADFNGLGCVKCHAIGDKGGSWGPNLTFIGFRKTGPWLDQWLKNPHNWRKETVMPNFNLTDEQRGDLVAFLSEQKGQAWDAPNTRPWNAEELKDAPASKRGEVLFNKAGCVACHAQGGRGGYPNNNVVGGQIPSLLKVHETYTKDELMKKIRSGVPQPQAADPSQPAPMVYMPTWGQKLSDDEIHLVVEYLFGLGGESSAAPGAKKDEW